MRPSLVELDWTTLARELVVTMLGVLIALALNSWWGVRQDHARERGYIRQVLADVDRSLAPSNLPRAEARERRAEQATIALLRAFRTPTAPPDDSIARWLYEAEDFTAYTPLTAAAHALISSRDLALIRRDSVRTIIIAMTATIDERATRMHDYQLKWQAQAEALEQYTDFVALRARVAGADSVPELPTGARREPWPAISYAALLQNRDVYRALVKMNTAHRNTHDILLEELNGLSAIRGFLVADAGR
jgi:hypothetical protein